MAHDRSKRGFAALPSQEQRRISGMGGRAAHASGHAHEWTPEEAHEYGRRGGLASHHHERAAFHHETAAHHHQRAAAQHAAGNPERAKLHADSASEHERQAGDHAEQALRYGQGRDEDERDSSPDRDDVEPLRTDASTNADRNSDRATDRGEERDYGTVNSRSESDGVARERER
jgi:hypothetical protein